MLALSLNRFDLDNFLGLGINEISISVNNDNLFRYLAKRWILLGANYKGIDPELITISGINQHIHSNRVISDTYSGGICLYKSDNPDLRVESSEMAELLDIKNGFRICRNEHWREVYFKDDELICFASSVKNELQQLKGENICNPEPQIIITHNKIIDKIISIRTDYFDKKLLSTKYSVSNKLLDERSLASDRMIIEINKYNIFDLIEFLKKDQLPTNSIVTISLNKLLEKQYQSEILIKGDINLYKKYLKNELILYKDRYVKSLNRDVLEYTKNIPELSNKNNLIENYRNSKIRIINKNLAELQKNHKQKLSNFSEDIINPDYYTHKLYPECKMNISVLDIELLINTLRELYYKSGIIFTLYLKVSYDIKLSRNFQLYQRISSDNFIQLINDFAIDLLPLGIFASTDDLDRNKLMILINNQKLSMDI